jgi:hypothetical protein
MLDANQLATIESAMAEEHRKDREALQRLKRFLPPNGSNGRVTQVLTIASDGTVEESEEPQTIIDKVEQVMQADPSKRWTVPAMVTYLKQINFPLAAKKPQATMGLVFAKLVGKRRTIRVVKRGAGRNPNVFRAVQPQQEGASDNHSQSERAAS